MLVNPIFSSSLNVSYPSKKKKKIQCLVTFIQLFANHFNFDQSKTFSFGKESIVTKYCEKSYNYSFCIITASRKRIHELSEDPLYLLQLHRILDHSTFYQATKIFA